MNSLAVVLATSISERQVDEGVKKYMNSHDLFGTFKKCNEK